MAVDVLKQPDLPVLRTVCRRRQKSSSSDQVNLSLMLSVKTDQQCLSKLGTPSWWQRLEIHFPGPYSTLKRHKSLHRKSCFVNQLTRNSTVPLDCSARIWRKMKQKTWPRSGTVYIQPDSLDAGRSAYGPCRALSLWCYFKWDCKLLYIPIDNFVGASLSGTYFKLRLFLPW